MTGCQIAYFGKKGVSIYQMEKEGKARLLSFGEISELKPVKSGFYKRVLIIGRHAALRIRKRYPPMSQKKLHSAVALDAPNLFPFQDCALYCRISETHATHILADIWAWEKKSVDAIQAAFSFGYVVPEDLAFLAAPLGLFIYPEGDVVHVVAAGDGRFLDAASYPVAAFSKEDLARFLAGLTIDSALLRQINFYEGPAMDLPSNVKTPVNEFSATGEPPYLRWIKETTLKSFKGNSGLWPEYLGKTALMRYALYGVLAYGLMLFLTQHHYDKGLAGLKIKLTAIDSEISLQTDESTELQEDVAREVEARRTQAVSPLRVLDILAAELPEETYVKSLTVNQGVIETVVASHDPMALLKKLGGSKAISHIALKGSPVKDSQSGFFNSNYLLEIKP